MRSLTDPRSVRISRVRRASLASSAACSYPDARPVPNGPASPRGSERLSVWLSVLGWDVLGDRLARWVRRLWWSSRSRPPAPTMYFVLWGVRVVGIAPGPGPGGGWAV